MALVTENLAADLHAPVRRCEVMERRTITTSAGVWRILGPCGSDATQVIVNTHAPGYCPVCDDHAAQFHREAPHATARVVSLAQFETERADGLYPKPS